MPGPAQISSANSIPVTLRSWLQQRDWVLALSAGYFGFFAHCGVIDALEREGLKPTELHGASAGALVAGFWAGGLTASQIADQLLPLNKSDFWDPAPGPGLIRGRKFAALLRDRLPVDTFDTCRLPLTISVFDLVTLRTRSIRRGRLEPAIRASCAVPGLFQPVRVRGRPSIDGGVLDRPALRAVDPSKAALCHFLLPQSVHRATERHLPRLSENRVVLAFDGLPHCGPDRLHYGVAAMRMAARRMRAALDAPVSSTMLCLA